MFKKLDLSFDDNIKNKILKVQKFIDKGNILYRDESIDCKFKQYEEGTDEDILSKQYSNIYPAHKQVVFPLKEIKKYIPLHIQQKEEPHIHWQVFDGGSIIPPHIDRLRQCTINVYTQISDEETIVYKKNRDGCRLETEQGLITHESFVPEWLTEIGRYKANLWDFYLLNVSIPHAVINMTDKPRISISYSFYKTSFEELNDLIG
jgi:hypothetical protein